MSIKDIKFDKKMKIGIAAFIIIVILAILSIGYIICNNIAKPNSEAFEDPYQAKQVTVPADSTNQDEKKADADKDIAKKEENKVNYSKEEEDKIRSEHKDALSSNSENATPIQEIFYSSFGGKVTYPEILSNPESNITKIFTVYTLENLKSMKALEDEVFNDKVDKVTYYNALNTVTNTLNGLIDNSLKIVSNCQNDTDKENAQELANLIQVIKGQAAGEYKLITEAPSFGKPMIKTYPFGANLEDNIKSLEVLSDKLGCDNQEALDKWINFSKQNLNMYLK